MTHTITPRIWDYLYLLSEISAIDKDIEIHLRFVTSTQETWTPKGLQRQHMWISPLHLFGLNRFQKHCCFEGFFLRGWKSSTKSFAAQDVVIPIGWSLLHDGSVKSAWDTEATQKCGILVKPKLLRGHFCWTEQNNWWMRNSQLEVSLHVTVICIAMQMSSKKNKILCRQKTNYSLE